MCVFGPMSTPVFFGNGFSNWIPVFPPPPTLFLLTTKIATPHNKATLWHRTHDVVLGQRRADQDGPMNHVYALSVKRR